MPQSDPIPPPAPRCPNVGPLATASAVVKREPPRGRVTTGGVLDIELVVTLSPNPVVLVPHAATVYGGVIIEQFSQPVDPTRAVVLFRPSGTVGREGTWRVLFGVRCKEGTGSLRVDGTFVSPLHDGDKVPISVVEGT